MRFLDLGPLAVEIDGAPQTLGGRRVESVAAALLVHAGAPVPGPALIDAVWGDAPPAGAAGALGSLIWRLRRVLEPGRPARDAALVRRDEQGYRLAVPVDAVDSHVLTAAAATTATDPTDVLRTADDALRRWRGTPYDGLPDPALDPVRSRLAEERVAVAQHRLAALLATGHPDRAVADLVPLITEHPYRESLWDLRLRALYASGRQQAALAAFQELRRVLADELGVEPGPDVRRLHGQILAHDPALARSAPAPLVAAGPRAVDVHLPRRRTRFVGRDAELRDLAARLAADRVVTLVGPGGVEGEVVRPLDPLPLPDADTAAARAASPAVALFRDRVTARGEPASLDGPDGAAVARICAAVDGLPLGIELAAARVGTFSLQEIADGLGRDPGSLSRLGRGPARQHDLHAEVDWSYRLATPEERIAHRRLAVLPRPFTLDAAEAVCGSPPLRPGRALDLVGGLAHRSLLASAGPARPGGPTWFAQLDTVRAHALGALRDAGEEEAVVAARTRWVVDRVTTAPRYGRPGQIPRYEWLDDNRATIDTALEAALHRGPPATLAFALVRLVRYWIDRMHVVTGRRLLRLAADVAWPDPLAAAVASAALGVMQAVDQDMAAARPRLLAALPVLVAAPEEWWADVGDLLTGMAAAIWTGDDWPLAAEVARTAAGFGERTGDVHVVLTARAVGSAADLIVGDQPSAMVQARAVLAEEAEVGDDFAALFAAATLGIGAAFTGDPEAGLAWTAEILRRQVALGIDDVADVLEQRGGHLDTVGRLDDAVRTLSASAARQRRAGRAWPRTEGTAERLDRLRTSLGAARFTLAWRAGQDVDLAELTGFAQQPGSRAAR